MTSYNKKHHSYEQQLDKLIARGMSVKNRAAAIYALQQINYYRLGVYWHHYEMEDNTHRFKPNTQFETIIGLYNFDRKLRLLVLEALEHIEVSIRANWAYQMSEAHGTHAHLIPEIHKRKPRQRRNLWEENLEKMKKDIRKSDKPFIKTQIKKYGHLHETPAIWVVSEVLSFGSLSRWYWVISDKNTKQNIAKVYQIHSTVLQSWLHHLTIVRNNCAHFACLWEHDFDTTPPIYPPRRHHILFADDFVKGNPLYNSIVIIIYMLDRILPNHVWRQRFQNLLAEHPEVPIREMGFPDNWQEHRTWKPKKSRKNPRKPRKKSELGN